MPHKLINSSREAITAIQCDDHISIKIISSWGDITIFEDHLGGCPRNDNPKLTTCDHRILTTLFVILLLRVKILSIVFTLLFYAILCQPDSVSSDSYPSHRCFQPALSRRANQFEYLSFIPLTNKTLQCLHICIL